MLHQTSSILLSTGELMEPWKNETFGGELMPPWGYNLAIAVLWFNQIFGSILNILVIIFMCTDTQIWNPINIILFNLVCSDFAVSILGNPFALTSAHYHRWMFGETGCQFYGFLMALFGINAITTMSVLAFDRYFLVCRPFSANQLNNHGAKIVVIFIWLYSAAVTCPPLFGWGAFVPEAANISCSVNWEEKSFNSMTYIIYIFTFGLVVPMLLVFYSYGNILITMRQSAIRLNKTSTSERKVTSMVLLMITAFVIAWAPYATFALIKQFGNGDIITPGIGVVPSIFAKTSIVYNPIIYVYMNSQFKVAFERIIRKKRTPRIMTMTTAAAISDKDDLRQTIRERLRTVNIDDEPHIENIELQTLQPSNIKTTAINDFDDVQHSASEKINTAKVDCECRTDQEEEHNEIDPVKITVEESVAKGRNC